MSIANYANHRASIISPSVLLIRNTTSLIWVIPHLC